MEVHTHSHTESPPAGRAGKKWTHYLWEFLMLFLAVFCGFLAENQREHMVEHNRAKAYAQSLYKDLQNDTADIRKAGWYENTVDNMIDSLVNFISHPNLLQKGGRLYYYMRFTSWSYNIDWSTATLNQLINSGNLRYFSSAGLVTQISNYNTLINIITETDASIYAKRNRAVAYRDRVFIPAYQHAFANVNMDDIYYGTQKAFIDSLKNINMPVQSNSAEMISAYTNAILDTKSNRKSLREKNYPKAIKLATEIMDLLKKEYHLK